MMRHHQFCAIHNQTYPPESSCPKCRAAEKAEHAEAPQVRRIITIARTMQARWGWDRRRAIRFALETVKRNPSPRKRTRREMSGETQEYLNHRNRSTSR